LGLTCRDIRHHP